MAAGSFLIISATACHFSDFTPEREAPRETSARLLKELRRIHADRPWIKFIRDIRYVPDRDFSGFDDIARDFAFVLTSIDASDGTSAEEARYASEICSAVQSLPPYPWTVLVKGADNTDLEKCTPFDAFDEIPPATTTTPPQNSPAPSSESP